MKPFLKPAVFSVMIGMVICSGCSGEPSQDDIREILERGAKENNIVLHEVKKLGCKDSGEPKKGDNFYCDAEVDLTTPSSGREKEILVIDISKGVKERWVLRHTRKKISEFQGRYSDAMGTTTIVFEPGGEASLFRKEGGSYAGKYEIDGRKVKIISRSGEILLTLNLYDDGTLWMETKSGRNHFKRT